jgi:hypothetical protein
MARHTKSHYDVEVTVDEHTWQVKGFKRDSFGFMYLEVHFPSHPFGGTKVTRHYPQGFGVSPLVDPAFDSHEACIFLEGAPCYIWS